LEKIETRCSANKKEVKGLGINNHNKTHITLNNSCNLQNLLGEVAVDLGGKKKKKKRDGPHRQNEKKNRATKA